jgi:hypothetical protein
MPFVFLFGYRRFGAEHGQLILIDVPGSFFKCLECGVALGAQTLTLFAVGQRSHTHEQSNWIARRRTNPRLRPTAALWKVPALQPNRPAYVCASIGSPERERLFALFRETAARYQRCNKHTGGYRRASPRTFGRWLKPRSPGPGPRARHTRLTALNTAAGPRRYNRTHAPRALPRARAPTISAREGR